MSPLSSRVIEQQLLYFGNLARNADSPARPFVFEPGSIQLKKFEGKRRKGRPRLQWNEEVYKYAEIMSRSIDKLCILIADLVCWREQVRLYCRTILPQ